MVKNEVVRFDWAIKNILRDKANFDVLEGFLSALLKTDITVLQLLESESNQEEDTKFNRVDLLVLDSDNRKIIIEVQNQREVDYLERLLYGTSKAIVENLKIGKPYKDIDKIISVSILYFNLGTGDDYVYHGKTEFKGIHSGNKLIVKEKANILEKVVFQEKQNIFPEYYLIQVERFKDQVQEDLDEWIYMFKNSKIEKIFKSKNIDKAREKLDTLKMSKEEKKAYDRYIENLIREKDIIGNAKQEGIEEGIKEEKINTVLNSFKAGLDTNIISQITNLTIDEVKNIIDSLKTR